MKYFTKPDGTPTKDYTKGYPVREMPLKDDGTVLPKHEATNTLEVDADGELYEFYETTPTNGVYKADLVKIDSASTEALRVQAKATRDSDLQTNTYTLTVATVDYVYQVRPQDLVNFQIAIDGAVDEEWVLADNSVRLTTVAELGEIMSAGVVQAKAVWTTYKEAIKAL